MAIQTMKLGKLARLYKTLNKSEGELDTLRWFIGMRYKVGFGLLAVLLMSYTIGLGPAVSVINLIAATLVYLAGTGIYDFALRNNPSQRLATFIRNLQIPEHMLLCTVAVYLNGGVLTPMVLVYPVSIVQAIILTDPRGVYRTGAFSILMYCGLSLLEAYHIIPYIGGYWAGGNFHETATAATYALYITIVSSLLMTTAYMGNRVARVIYQRNLQIQSQLQDLRTLYDIANGLGNILEEDAMLRYLANTLKTLQNASSCVIGMVDKEGYIAVKASSGVPPGTLSRLAKVSVDTPALAPIFEKGEPIVIEDIDKQPEYRQLLVNAGTKCAYLFPIKCDGKVVGSISLAFEDITHINEEYGSLLTTIAVQAGVALQRAHLFTSTQQLAREMSVLYDVGLYTGSTLSRDEVIKRTSDTIEKLMNPDAYYLALYDPETNMLSFETFVECGQQMPKMRVALNKGGLTGRIIESSKPLLVQDWLTDGQQYNGVANKTGTDMLSYLGVPMIAEDKVVGVISVQSEQPRAFDLHHERMLVALAAQTAMALENARLHQLAQDQAKYDSLTKAYNHGMFVELVRKAVDNSDCDDGCVALIMLDIDHFKKYNDTYGHVAGDNVLRMVANAIKSSVRETDFVGRWGGEEFCVLLPGAGVQEAKKVARYIRRAIAELYPVDGHGHLIPNPTVSQGISSYPYPSAGPNQIIEDADEALYQAKRRGRNQLIVYEAKGVLREATTTTGHLSVKILNRNPNTITTGNLANDNNSRRAHTITTGNLLASSGMAPDAEAVTTITTTSRLA